MLSWVEYEKTFYNLRARTEEFGGEISSLVWMKTVLNLISLLDQMPADLVVCCFHKMIFVCFV